MFVCTLCPCLSAFPQKLRQTTAKSPRARRATSLVEVLLQEPRLRYITCHTGIPNTERPTTRPLRLQEILRKKLILDLKNANYSRTLIT